MRTVSKKVALIAFEIILMVTPILAQQKTPRGNEAGLKYYMTTLTEQNTFIAECERKRNSVTGPSKIIAGHCEFGGGGCPVRLVIPRYPSAAREMKIRSVVEVDVIADETGRIIYSRAIRGSNFFRKGAERAARRSQFTAALSCGKPIKRRFVIRYNFAI